MDGVLPLSPLFLQLHVLFWGPFDRGQIFVCPAKKEGNKLRVTLKKLRRHCEECCQRHNFVPPQRFTRPAPADFYPSDHKLCNRYLKMGYANLPSSVHPGVVTGQAMLDLLNHAKENGYAIPAVNCVSSSGINACLEAARKNDSPVIIQFSAGGSQVS